jgi:ABC-2 type transport system permease protein
MNAWQITRKDVTLLVRDRRTIFVLVALPLAFITILGLSTGQLFNQREKARQVRVGVVDEDQSDLSGKLLDEVYKIQALQINEFQELRKAKRMLVDGDLDVLVRIGPHYHERVERLDVGDLFYPDRGRLAGDLENLDITVDAGSFLANAAQVVQQLVFAFSLRTFAPDVLKKDDPRLAEKLFLKARRTSRESKHAQSSDSDELPTAPVTTMDVYQILVPSYTVMFVFFIVNLMARSFIAERDMQTLNRLRIADITRSGLLFGKTTPFLLVSLVQTVLLFLAGKTLFGMSWGVHPFLLLPVMLATSLAAVALGLLVATTARTDSQVSAYGNFLVLTLAGISGCLMPRSWQPHLMQQLGLVTPHAWALIGYDQLLNQREPDLALVARCVGVLLGFAAGFFVLGLWRYRKLES